MPQLPQRQEDERGLADGEGQKPARQGPCRRPDLHRLSLRHCALGAGRPGPAGADSKEIGRILSPTCRLKSALRPPWMAEVPETQGAVLSTDGSGVSRELAWCGGIGGTPNEKT